MRVLVTGAAGFLGSHLTDALLADGCSVIGVDNLSSGSLENLAHHRHDGRFAFKERDITEPFDPGKAGLLPSATWYGPEARSGSP